ncbi:MAG: hypothetical protein AB1894_10555 [Chloroflexota bacterium]
MAFEKGHALWAGVGSRQFTTRLNASQTAADSHTLARLCGCADAWQDPEG